MVAVGGFLLFLFFLFDHEKSSSVQDPISLS